MLNGSLRREDVKVRVQTYITPHNRMYPTKSIRFGDLRLVSLDEVMFENESMTRSDTVSRGLELERARDRRAARRHPAVRMAGLNLKAAKPANESALASTTDMKNEHRRLCTFFADPLLWNVRYDP
jgi:hypothetical protein